LRTHISIIRIVTYPLKHGSRKDYRVSFLFGNLPVNDSLGNMYEAEAASAGIWGGYDAGGLIWEYGLKASAQANNHQ